VLKVAVVVVLAGMLVTWLAMRTDETDGAAPQKTARRFESFEQLIRQGKTEMQAKRWEEAARLFAQAQKIRDDSPEVKKLKKVAIMEVDAKAAVEAALQAREEEKWQAALNELSRIPLDSYYYNLSFLREMGDKLCDDLVYKADFMITSGDPAAGELVDAISKIPEVSAECLARQDHLRMRLETRP